MALKKRVKTNFYKPREGNVHIKMSADFIEPSQMHIIHHWPII